MLPDPELKKVNFQVSAIIAIAVEAFSVGPEPLLMTVFESCPDSSSVFACPGNARIIPVDTVVIHSVPAVAPG